MNAAVKTIKSGASTGLCALDFSWIKQHSLSALLWILLAGSMLSVVYITNETRTDYATLQAQQSEREALHVEWGKLLLERGVWTSQVRVEEAAERYLNMTLPTVKSTIIVVQ